MRADRHTVRVAATEPHHFYDFGKGGGFSMVSLALGVRIQEE